MKNFLNRPLNSEIKTLFVLNRPEQIILFTEKSVIKNISVYGINLFFYFEMFISTWRPRKFTMSNKYK